VPARRPFAGHTLIIASGAEIPQLELPNLSRFEGVGVYYGATALEGQLCADEEIAIVGGGNSAGQAAMFLSGIAKHVHFTGARGGPERDHVALPDPQDRRDIAHHPSHPH